LDRRPLAAARFHHRGLPDRALTRMPPLFSR